MHTTYKHIGKPSRLLVFLDEGVASPWYSHIETQRGYLSFWACLVLTYLTSQLDIDDIAGSRIECVGFTGSYWPLDHWTIDPSQICRGGLCFLHRAECFPKLGALETTRDRGVMAMMESPEIDHLKFDDSTNSTLFGLDMSRQYMLLRRIVRAINLDGWHLQSIPRALLCSCWGSAMPQMQSTCMLLPLNWISRIA